MEGKISRREFIRLGIGAGVALLLIRDPLKLIAAAREEEGWEMPAEGRISFVSGQVFVNDNPADVDDAVQSGDTVRTGPGSEVDIELRDYAIFRLQENSTVLVADILGEPKLSVKKGWFLIIVKRKTTLNVETPTALAGVRGTVFFFNVLSETEVYHCNCNGDIELTDPKSGRRMRRVVSRYHTAFHLRREGGEVRLISAKLLYHHDSDILKIAGRFPRETSVFREGDKGGGNGGY